MGFRTHYKCICSCGNERIVSKDKLLKGNLKSCGCKKHLCGPLNKTWKGYGEIPRKYFSNLRHHAIKLRNIPFEISIEEMWDLFYEKTQNLKLIPDKFKTPKMCFDYLKMFQNFDYIPEQLQTQEMWNYYYKKFHDVFTIPVNFTTQKMWNKYFYKTPEIDFVPEKFKNKILLKQLKTEKK